MIVPTLTVAISRASLPGGLSPLLFTGSRDGAQLKIVGYQAPARVARITYAPDSVDVDGAEAIAAAWDQTNLGIDWAIHDAASETVLQTAYAEVAAAIGQFSYTVTTQVSGAPAEVWAADRGTLVPSARTYENLANISTVFALTIPVRPIPGSA